MEIYGSDIRGGVLHEKGALNGRSLPTKHRSEKRFIAGTFVLWCVVCSGAAYKITWL
jgi:hypothetical protein